MSILTSLGILTALGETINIMTLGGLALAVGILVDDATVAVENTYRLMEAGKEFEDSVVQGAAGIAKPALISTLAICSAFLSVLFLNGAPKFLFTPQALAVVFAMLASYLLSRTLVPILIDVLVRKEHEQRHGAGRDQNRKPNVFARFQAAFERGFENFHRGYIGLLRALIGHPVATLFAGLCVLVLGGTLFIFLGRDNFPQVDAGAMTLHIRTRPGERIETTEQTFAAVEKMVRAMVPSDQIALILDNIGLPSTNYNFAFGDGSFVGYNDGQMLISLNPEHEPTAGFMRKLRSELPKKFPDTVFYFQPSDMITQILDFGTITPIDVQVNGRNKVKDLDVALSIERRLKEVEGVVDVHLHQIVHTPEFFVDVDRRLASEFGSSEQQIASAMNVSLAGSFQVNPNFWSDPKTGIPYQLWVQSPEYRNDTMEELRNTPLFVQANVAGPDGNSALQMLSSVATLRRTDEQTVTNHVNTQPTYDILASVQDRDLAAVQADIGKLVQDEQKQLPAPDSIHVRGQIESMDSAFNRIEIGLGIAVLAVYLLMAINFQSWADPFVVLCGLPIAFCGIVFSLYVTGTTLSIPSLFGAIMSVGVASANSILLVTFAREHREATGCDAAEAAIASGETRLRPVLMTAAAMFVGLIPMAIGVGEGSEQNAALARAVLGGVAFGTAGTLLFVPFLYSILKRKRLTPANAYN